MREHFPLATRALHIENAIENFAKINLSWMSKAFG